MTKTNWIIVTIVIILILSGVWYSMSQTEEAVAPETESMMTDDGTLNEEESGDDMIEAEVGGEFDGIIAE